MIKVNVKNATVMGDSFPDRLDLLIKVDVKNATVMDRIPFMTD